MSIPKPNSLIDQKSPYLLQHAHNPVNWYAWSDEAFSLATELDKPIFLSIGYSTCHWCHVMEHESFEDDEVAALLNDAFISIKVDREERPDIDSIYMNVCQMLTGSGGWPLTVMMTPDKHPFFAGTYFPKESRMGRIGMLELIPRVAGIWHSNRDEIDQSVDRISTALNRLIEPQLKSQLDLAVLKRGFDQLVDEFDSDFGGFGRSPKFPTPHRLTFLLRYWMRTADENARSMTIETLQHMARGGIFDHLGGGFHRYSTDRQWLLPHFEKMLYDQALIANALLEAFQATRDPEFERIARLILEYVLRDMTSSDGGFYSAEDADSEGEEGTFYVWNRNEIESVLGKSDGEAFAKQYGVLDEGNFLEESTSSLTGDNILNLIESDTENADHFANARGRLFDHRETRIHPYKDDKILSDWNGLMTATMAKAGRVLGEPRFLEAAINAWLFVERELISDSGDLLHRYRDGEAAISGYLDDYAFLVSGLIELYETTFEVQYLVSAIDLQTKVNDNFWDRDHGAFFFVNSNNEDVLVRLKESYDGAIPSGNSISMMNLLKLGRMTGNTDWEQKAWTISEYFSDMIKQVPASHSQMLSALDFALNETFEIVIAGKEHDPNTQSMLRLLRSHYLPHVVLVFVDMERQSDLIKIAPYLEGFGMIDEKATAFICKNFTCDLPITDLDKFEGRIQALSKSGFAK